MISWIIPHYGSNIDILKKCVESFVKYHSLDTNEVIIVDDGKWLDDYINEIKEIIKPIKILQTPTNVSMGFACSCNEGINRSSNNIVVLVNNDIEFTKKIDDIIVSEFNNDDKLGVMGAELYYPNGLLQHAGVQIGHGYLPNGHLLTHQPRHYSMYMTGALFAFRKSLGLLNEDYGIAHEDSEFCLRAWSAGYRVLYNPDIKAIHHEGYTRGNDTCSKGDKGTLYLEMETSGKFINDVKTKFNMELIDHYVKKANLETSDNVLFIRKAHLGDMVMLTGVLHEYHRLNPKTKIWLSCLEFTRELFLDCDWIETGRIPESIMFKAIYDFDMAYETQITKPVWESYAKVIWDDISDLDLTPRLWFNDEGQCIYTNYIVIHANKTWESRTIPEQTWIRLVQELTAKGYNILLVGTSQDYDLSKYNLSRTVSLINKTDLQDFYTVVSQAKAFISGDSGILHIATTTDTPTVSMWTVCNGELFIHPNLKNNIVLTPNINCKFCRERLSPRGYTECMKDKFKNECVKTFLVNDILDSLAKLGVN